MFLPDKTTTPYFMWLGGHDILAARHVECLFNILESQTPDYFLCAPNYYDTVDVYGNKIQTIREFQHPSRVRSSNAFIRTSYYVTSEGYNAIVNGLFRLESLKKYIFEYRDEEVYGGIDRLLIVRLLAKGKIYCSNSISSGYTVRVHRDKENIYSMMQRQKNMIYPPDKTDVNIPLEDFIEKSVRKQINVLENWCGIPYIDHFLKFYIEKKLLRKIVLQLLEPDIESFAEGKQDMENLTTQLRFQEKKMDSYVSLYAFWDRVCVLCLGRAIILLSERKIMWREYIKIKKDFYRRGGKIPLRRNVKWFLKYVLWRRWTRWIFCRI
jgi:hypothetical protein